MILFLILALYLATRLFNLTTLPTFLDEALYLRMVNDLLSKGDIWISFTDGKEPLFFWASSLFLSLLNDSLFAGRLLSLLSGLGTLTFAYLLTKMVLGNRVAYLTSCLLIFSPFFFFYTRLAILDSFLTFLLTGFVYFLLKSIKAKSLSSTLLAGVFLGLSLLTKTLSQLYLFTLPAIFLLYPTKKTFHVLSMILGIALVFYLPLKLTPGVESIELKNTVFKHPLLYSVLNFQTILIPNLKTTLRHWLPLYIGVIPLLLFAFGASFGLLKRNRIIIFLVALAVIPIILQAFVAKIFFPRYFLFSVVPLSIVAAWALNLLFKLIKNSKINLALFLITFAQPIFSTLSLIVYNDPAVLPEIEKWQYYYGWPSGYCMSLPFAKITNEAVILPKNGVAEAVKFHFYGNLKTKQPTYRLLNYYDSDITKTKVPLTSSLCQQPPKLYKL